MKNLKLGVFDSGLGGLTVVKALRAFYPYVDIVYLGDTARVPYGGRSPDVIVRYALECSRFLTSKNVDALVVACNTVSALAIPALKEQVEIPVLGVLEPGARAVSTFSRVGLLATRATVESGAYVRAVKNFSETEIISVASPLLVPLVEEGWAHGTPTSISVVAQVVSHYLQPLVRSRVEAIILGCTHYPILKSIIEMELGKLRWNVPLIDSGEELTKELVQNELNSRMKNGSPFHEPGKLEIFTTDESAMFHRLAEQFLSESLNDVLRVEL